MKRSIKISILLFSFVIVFIIYNLCFEKTKKISYIALGDSIAEGMNSYGIVDYGYPDYINDYLKEKNKLAFYTKEFSKSGYTIEDVKNDIDKNKVINVDNKKVYLKEALRESDIVTLTIGINDFLRKHDLNYINQEDIIKNKKEIDRIANDFKDLLLLIKKYAKNDIIVTGYFNPYPRNLEKKDIIDEIIKYYNNSIEEICNELEFSYVSIFEILENNEDAFSLPSNLHPNRYGYKLIADLIIKRIEVLTN